MAGKKGSGRKPLTIDRDFILSRSVPQFLSTCWNWIGPTILGGDKLPRGKISMGASGKIELAYRAAYRLFRGPIPDGLFVLHSCDNGLCVNPAHLFVGTQADNMADKVKKNRQARGERSGQARLTEASVREIRALNVQGMSERKLAARFGVSNAAIHSVLSGESWGWLE